MTDRECFDAVCALVPRDHRVSIKKGYTREGKLTGRGTTYTFTILAGGLTTISEKSFQAALDEWKTIRERNRSFQIAELEIRLSELKGGK